MEGFHDVCLLCWSRSCERSAEVPRQRREGHGERTEKLDGILLPEFYEKVVEVMQEEKPTVKSLQNSFIGIILDQWVSIHLHDQHNGQYVRPEKGVYHRRDVGSVSALVRCTFSISVL